MEIVLQWLDELDDLVFAGFSIWRRLRYACLGVALTAALGLEASSWLGFAGQSMLALLGVTIVALVVWSLAAALSAVIGSSRHSLAGNG